MTWRNIITKISRQRWRLFFLGPSEVEMRSHGKKETAPEIQSRDFH